MTRRGAPIPEEVLRSMQRTAGNRAVGQAIAEGRLSPGTGRTAGAPGESRDGRVDLPSQRGSTRRRRSRRADRACAAHAGDAEK